MFHLWKILVVGVPVSPWCSCVLCFRFLTVRKLFKYCQIYIEFFEKTFDLIYELDILIMSSSKNSTWIVLSKMRKYVFWYLGLKNSENAKKWNSFSDLSLISKTCSLTAFGSTSSTKVLYKNFLSVDLSTQ